MRSGGSRSSKVVDFGTCQKHVCNFLLVINSNLGPILLRFRDITGILLTIATPPLFHPNFGSVLLELDCRRWGSGERRPSAIYSCNYFRSNQTCTPTVPQRYRQTDGQTDRRTTYCSIVHRSVINSARHLSKNASMAMLFNAMPNV